MLMRHTLRCYHTYNDYTQPTCTPAFLKSAANLVTGYKFERPSVINTAILGIPSDSGRAPYSVGVSMTLAKARAHAVAVNPPR